MKRKHTSGHPEQRIHTILTHPSLKSKYDSLPIEYKIKLIYPKDFETEKKEHPTFTDLQIAQIVMDHKLKKK